MIRLIGYGGGDKKGKIEDNSPAQLTWLLGEGSDW
jgi:hypothetical protein